MNSSQSNLQPCAESSGSLPDLKCNIHSSPAPAGYTAGARLLFSQSTELNRAGFCSLPS